MFILYFYLYAGLICEVLIYALSMLSRIKPACFRKLCTREGEITMAIEYDIDNIIDMMFTNGDQEDIDDFVEDHIVED